MSRPGSRPRRNRRGSRPRTRLGTLEVGEEVTVKISAISRRGDGIARVRGYTVFVPNTRVGDVVRIRIVKVWSRYAVGDVISYEEGESFE